LSHPETGIDKSKQFITHSLALLLRFINGMTEYDSKPSRKPKKPISHTEQRLHRFVGSNDGRTPNTTIDTIYATNFGTRLGLCRRIDELLSALERMEAIALPRRLVLSTTAENI